MIPIDKFLFCVIAVHKEARKLICNGNQLIGFHMSWKNTESMINLMGTLGQHGDTFSGIIFRAD